MLLENKVAVMENLPEVVSPEKWLAARKELLVREKEVTHARAQVNADRRRLPMVRIDKPYIFDGPTGSVNLLDLFEGRAQLVMHHFMWMFDVDADGNEHPREAGCSSCASAADGIPQHLRQLHARNTTLVAVTRAPYAKIGFFDATTKGELITIAGTQRINESENGLLIEGGVRYTPNDTFSIRGGYEWFAFDGGSNEGLTIAAEFSF